jgi:hypothetical protein
MGYEVEIVLDGKTYNFDKDTAAPPAADGQSGTSDDSAPGEGSDPGHSGTSDDSAPGEGSEPGQSGTSDDSAPGEGSDPGHSDPGEGSDTEEGPAEEPAREPAQEGSDDSGSGEESDPEGGPAEEPVRELAQEDSDDSGSGDDGGPGGDSDENVVWFAPGDHKYDPVANPKYEFVYNPRLGIMQYDIPESWESGELIEDWREGPTSLEEPMTESEVTGGALTGTYAGYYRYTPYQIILVLNEDNATGYLQELDPAWPARPFTYRYVMLEEHPMYDNVYNGMIFAEGDAGGSHNEFVAVSPTILYDPGNEAIFYRID